MSISNVCQCCRLQQTHQHKYRALSLAVVLHVCHQCTMHQCVQGSKHECTSATLTQCSCLNATVAFSLTYHNN